MSQINNNTIHELIAAWVELHHNGQLKNILYDYADKGWHIFPVCWFNEAGECACGKHHEGNNIGKAPVTPHGMDDATQTHQGIDEYLNEYPLANWAGRFDCQLILDVDARSKGYQGLEKLKNDIGHLPQTRVHQSGGGGLHLIYKLPEGIELKANKLLGYPGIDIKINGYIILPPSPHVAGSVYVVKNNSPIADAPFELIDLIKKQRKVTMIIPTTSGKIHDGEGRNIYLTSEAGRLLNIYHDHETVKTMIRALNQAVCDPPLPECELTMLNSLKTWNIIETSNGNANNGHINIETGETVLENDKKPSPTILTDYTNAELLAELYGDMLRYDHRRGRWLIWEKHRWRSDDDAAIVRYAIKAARERYRLASYIQDLEERKRIANWAIGSENRVRLDACIAMAKSIKPIADTGENWDNDPWLLGVQNGVVDLRTGELRPGRREDRITMSTGVFYDPDAKAPRFEQFNEEIFNGDKELIDWMWRNLGYSITGDMTEQIINMGYGEGGNGKGKLTEAIRTAMGDYAYDAPFSTFELFNRTSIPNDIAALEHRRFVSSSETNDGTRLNEA